MKLKKRYIFFGLVVLLSPALFIQSTKEQPQINKEPIIYKAPQNPYLQKFLAEYDSAVRSQVHKTPGAAIAIVKGDSVIFSEGFGIRSIKSGDSIDVNTVFRIGSVSKGVAAVLSGIMAQDSVINLDDEVAKHYDDFKLKDKTYTDSIKIKHILSQSTGLPYQAYTTMIENGNSLDYMIEALGGLDLIGPPGKYYSYQNVGYSVIERVLENASNQSFEELLSERLFKPIGMKTASSTYEELLSMENIAMPHVRGKGTWYQRKISPNYYNTKAAGGVNASISDMAEYLKALLGHKPDVVSQHALTSIFEPQIRTYIRYKYFSKWPNAKKSWYGMGWRIVENGNDTVIYHGGYVNYYSSKIALIPSEDIGICVLTNAPNKFVSTSIPMFLEIYDKYRDQINDWERSQYYTVVATR